MTHSPRMKRSDSCLDGQALAAKVKKLSIEQLEQVAQSFLPWFERPEDVGIGYTDTAKRLRQSKERLEPGERPTRPGAQRAVQLEPEAFFLKHFPVFCRLADLVICKEREETRAQRAQVLREQLVKVPYGSKTRARRSTTGRAQAKHRWPPIRERRVQILLAWGVWRGRPGADLKDLAAEIDRHTLASYRRLFGWGLEHIDRLILEAAHSPGLKLVLF